ncbi:hypothetical protein BCR32DRAFT_297822 [Anaeromyces robustus]|uniref:Uncharacterized protein n=1 Tax=Anaeromyces robustus TaxID=1754192 RepID=A0A1Y1VVR8_9FUNG|nr:hypothetical protein BCR32DRAFT_297822 [Anaeromyces robustus]|eukprot:ORX65115.1 hypothetical protein BCR32DRAFT_297822 [Anaeromyces robustus]
MVSLRRSINDRANNYNYKYMNCYLETITRTVSVSLLLIDIALLVYGHLNTGSYAFIFSHIISCSLYFLSTFKTNKYFVLQFIVFTTGFVLYTIYNFTIALTLFISEGFKLNLLRLSLNGGSSVLSFYSLYIAIVFYIRILNDACCDASSFEDEIEETNVQLIIEDEDYDDDE